MTETDRFEARGLRRLVWRPEIGLTLHELPSGGSGSRNEARCAIALQTSLRSP